MHLNKNHTFSRRALAMLLTLTLCLSLVPSAFAAQQNSYHDPAEHWMQASNRTNELDVNSVVTRETFKCGECGKVTSFEVFRVPEYTRNGQTALSRNVKYSDGTMMDGVGKGDCMDGVPGKDAYYTGYHYTKAVCETCGGINTNEPKSDYGYLKNVYWLFDCAAEFTQKLEETVTYEYTDDTYHTEMKTESGYMHTSDIEYRVEMVTPKLTYAELPRLQECVRQVRHAGAKANISCGIHVHVDAANHNRQSLKNLLSIMYSKEDILFKALQVNERRASRWCQKVREPMLKEARKLSSDETKNLTALESIWYEGNISDREHYNWTRYYALNLHSVFYRGTVEWRCFNSTLHAGKIAAYVNLCLAMSAQAINQRSTVMRKTYSDNELFTFRVWLVRLGLNGDEFKNTRNHLLANLDGDRAYRYPDKMERKLSKARDSR